MREKTVNHGGEAFLRAYTDMVRDCESEYQVSVHSDMHITERKGVVCWHWEARKGVLGSPGYVKVGHYSAEYPNSRAWSLEAFLYASSVRLHRLVGDWCAAEEESAPA